MKNSILKTGIAALLIMSSLTVFSQKKETRDVSNFKSVGLSIAADLYLTQGSEYMVVIEAPEVQLAMIETEVKDGNLRIKCEQRNARLKDVKVWVTMPDVNGLYLSGSGTIMAETAVKSDELELKVSGSGQIKIAELSGDELDVSISGSGNVTLEGSSEEAEVHISGSGSCHASGLKVDEVDVRISGSGSCKIDATGELDAAISGSGRVYYYSNPQVDAKVSGSGKVVKGDM